MLKNCFLILLLLVPIHYSFSQNIQKMEVWQDSLYNLGKSVFGDEADVRRIESNFNFVRTLVSALKEPNAYYYTFDKLNMISIVKAPDDSFRIFSWNVPLHDGSYLYYGAVQFRAPSLKLIPLLDKTFDIKNPEKEILSPTQWYGAQYYDIAALGKNQYVLLGWKGHNAEYTKKVIDILNVEGQGNISFGAPVFSDAPQHVRKIFNYNRMATMLLRYNRAKNLLEFDNLIQLDSSLGDTYKNYVPDLSHNGYKLQNGKLKYEDNIQVVNAEEDLLRQREAPKNTKSGLGLR